jgi:hypothetical protein
MIVSEYITLTELGALYGVTNQKIGQWLREAGLRDKRGNPINEGLWMTTEALAQNGYTPFFVWHRQSTIRLLDSLGYRRKDKYNGSTPTYSGTYRPGTGEHA